MGLSIHYNGRFNKNSSLEEMILEIEDISKIYNWEYHVFERKFPDSNWNKTEHDSKLYGICFTPPGCETVFISFLSNGRMSGAAQLQLYAMSEDPEEASWLYQLFVKTQYAGSEIHMVLIHLLKYLDKKYFLEFEVQDEGQYWETGDKELLRDTFKEYTQLLNAFSHSLQNTPKNANETLESYIERLAMLLNKNINPDL